MTAVDIDAVSETMRDKLGPVATRDRVFTLDMLRGWAVLGILAVNAMAFAWPFAVEMARDAKPFAVEGANLIGTWVTDVFFSDKFRSLFSMLFGVSIFLVGGERSDDARGKLLRRRLFWMGVFGLIHGAVVWYGDILFHYAYCGLLMMLMRSWSAKRLLWIGGGVTLLWGLLAFGGGLMMANLPPEAAAQMKEGQPSLTPEQIMAMVETVRSGWLGAVTENLKQWMTVQMFSLFLIPVTVPLMMLGLGLYKSGFFVGRAPAWVYGLFVGLGAANLVLLGSTEWMKLNAPVGQDPTGGLAGAAGGMAPLITLAYASALILMTRFGLKVLTGVFAPVGRMAFTNYLTQSILMAALFYMPWGPQFYGQVGPGGLWAFVGGIWALQLIWSPLWLSRFEFGPLEWLWRSLTYGRRVPLRKVAVA